MGNGLLLLRSGKEIKMIKRKQFYGIFSLIILIFIAVVFISKSGGESVQGDSLRYKNGVLYTKDGGKYTGKVTEAEGYKAKINGIQIAKGFITVKNGALNGKFEFISFNEFWNGAEVKGKAANGSITELRIKNSEEVLTLKNKDIEKYFKESINKNQTAQNAVLSALGINESANGED